MAEMFNVGVQVSFALIFNHQLGNYHSEPEKETREIYSSTRTQIGFGLGHKSCLGSYPNHIWARTQIIFGLGPKSYLGSDPNQIWART